MKEFDSYSEEKQRMRVKAGMKGGPFHKDAILHPPMRIVDAVPSEVKAKGHYAKPMKGKVEDPWY